MILDPWILERNNRLIPVLKKAIVATFTDGDWKEVAYSIDEPNTINSHPRLLRSLNWGDPDYDGCVFDVLERLLPQDPDNSRAFLNNDKIKDWIKNNDSTSYQEWYDDSDFIPSFVPETISARQVVETALTDAEILLQNSGPVSAVDRTHTALHGYLIALCDKYRISYNKGSRITELFKVLRQNVPPLRNLDTSSKEIAKITKALATILDCLNPIRNRGSIAHPNEQLIGTAEATLAINVARTILHYLDEKL